MTVLFESFFSFLSPCFLLYHRPQFHFKGKFFLFQWGLLKMVVSFVLYYDLTTYGLQVQAGLDCREYRDQPIYNIACIGRNSSRNVVKGQEIDVNG